MTLRTLQTFRTPPAVRSCLAPHGEVPTRSIIARALATFSIPQLEDTERELTAAIQDGRLHRQGQQALTKVRSTLARRKLAAAFAE